MEYTDTDFELVADDVQTIKEAGQKRITFQIHVQHSPEGETLQKIPSEYDAVEMGKLLQNWDHWSPEWPEMLKLGNWLGNVLFPPDVRQLFISSIASAQKQKKGLRLRLFLTGELHNVPWEYALLNRGGGEATRTDFLGLTPDISIVRHQAATLPAPDIKAADLPAQILVALASPITGGYAPLGLADEQERIKQALAENPYVQASYLPKANSAALANVRQAHLFHFAGHGKFQGEMGTQPGTIEGQGSIIFEDDCHDPEEFEAGQLAVQLRRIGVRVAVFGACESGRRDNVNIWSSVAAALLKAGVGAVVGMQFKIKDRSAIVFAQEFYRTLVSGFPIDEAVANARIAMANDDPKGWGIPVLYLRAQEGVVFPEYATRPELEELREQIQVKAQQRIGELRGKAIAVDIEEMSSGSVTGEQIINTVAEGGEATAVKIKKLGGGNVKADQQADTVSGTMTGVSIGNLG